MTRYVRFDTTHLDPLADVDQYTEAGKAMDQARQAVSEVAAYRDAIVAAMVEARPHRGGHTEVARLLGVHRNVVSTHTKHHKERTMSHTITEYVPVLKAEISRIWTQKDDVWSTDVNGTRWVLYRDGSAGGWNGPDRPVWAWGPVGGGQDVPTIKSSTVEEAMKDATRHIDINPAVEEWQRQHRKSQDS